MTAAFAHASWEHLSSNIFMLYVFGRIVEVGAAALSAALRACLCLLGSLQAYPLRCVSTAWGCAGGGGGARCLGNVSDLFSRSGHAGLLAVGGSQHPASASALVQYGSGQ